MNPFDTYKLAAEPKLEVRAYNARPFPAALFVNTPVAPVPLFVIEKIGFESLPDPLRGKASPSEYKLPVNSTRGDTSGLAPTVMPNHNGLSVCTLIGVVYPRMIERFPLVTATLLLVSVQRELPPLAAS